MRERARGFNMIELMITLTILGVLISLAVPSFSDWLQNQQTRAAAEATLNGLQAARGEAVGRNVNVSFQLMGDLSSTCALAIKGANGFLVGTSGFNTAGGTYVAPVSWVVSTGNASNACDKRIGDTPPGPVIQSRLGSEATPTAVITTVPDSATTITFTPIGGTTSNPDGSAALQSVTVSSAVLTGPAARSLRVVINPGGSLRLCDPSVAAPDTRACP